ncbi:MAG: hypothetical protein ACI93T_002219, partial [Porticoccaceae bacterium]
MSGSWCDSEICQWSERSGGAENRDRSLITSGPYPGAQCRQDDGSIGHSLSIHPFRKAL